LHRLAAVSLSLGSAINLLSCSDSPGARAAGRTLAHEERLVSVAVFWRVNRGGVRRFRLALGWRVR
jgi:hypothetical protein